MTHIKDDNYVVRV